MVKYSYVFRLWLLLGIDRITQKNLIGTWKYKGPGCAFTSENTLAKAGGEIAATQVKEKMASQYSKLGFSATNTYITFENNGSFSAWFIDYLIATRAVIAHCSYYHD